MYHIPSILFPSSKSRLGILSNKSAAVLDTDKCFVFGRIIICNNSKRGLTLAGREEVEAMYFFFAVAQSTLMIEGGHFTCLTFDSSRIT